MMLTLVMPDGLIDRGLIREGAYNRRFTILLKKIILY